MNQTLLFLHSIFRWLVLFSLIYTIYIAFIGFYSKSHFTKRNDSIRHWSATIAHIQLMLGIVLYTQSPMTTQFFKYYHFSEGWNEAIFFGLFHILLMLMAITLITIGSASAKRKESSSEKFKTILIFYSLALLIILIAIPWPFSPLGNRPLIRTF